MNNIKLKKMESLSGILLKIGSIIAMTCMAVSFLSINEILSFYGAMELISGQVVDYFSFLPVAVNNIILISGYFLSVEFFSFLIYKASNAVNILNQKCMTDRGFYLYTITLSIALYSFYFIGGAYGLVFLFFLAICNYFFLKNKIKNKIKNTNIKIKQKEMYYFYLMLIVTIIMQFFFINVVFIIKITNTINEYDVLILLVVLNVISSWFFYMSYHAKNTYIARGFIYFTFFLALYSLTNIFHAINNFSFNENGYIKNETHIMNTQKTKKIMVNKNSNSEGEIKVISVFSMSGKSIYCNDEVSDDIRKKNSISFLKLRVGNEISRYCFVSDSQYN